MKRIGLITLGCPKNLVDSEVMLGQLVEKGYSVASDPADSDIIIVNTCGFIGPAKKESIDTILTAAQWKAKDPDKKLIVAGCLVQRYGKELKDELAEVDHFVTLNDVERIVEACSSEFDERLDREPAQYIYDGKAPRILTTPASFAYLKIAEGCDHTCSFCAIPSMRGKYRSRTIRSIADEARKLIDQGVKELILISQDSTIYGWDLGLREGLAQLAKQLANLSGVERIRVLYCYPTSLRRSFLDVVASESRLCRYIDMPLQHASSKVLASMQRGGSAAQYLRMIDDIRKRIPDVAIRTTFITGYPGETDQDFRELYDFIGEAEFDRLGVFLYSDEEGTSAFQASEQLPRRVKIERRRELMKLQAGISRRKNEALVGRRMNVLIDGGDSKGAVGRLYSQAPDIDGLVRIRKMEAPAGEMIDVIITGAGAYDLTARAYDHDHRIRQDSEARHRSQKP